MPNSWKDKTCEGCEYRNGICCRRFPPVCEGIFIFKYPKVKDGNDYSPACAEFKPREEKG